MEKEPDEPAEEPPASGGGDGGGDGPEDDYGIPSRIVPIFRIPARKDENTGGFHAAQDLIGGCLRIHRR